MQITATLVQEKFREFNRLMFGNRLKALPVYLTHARTYVGKFTASREPLPLKQRLAKCKFSFSVIHDLPQEEWEDTIIHEMIHYDIYVVGRRDTSAHGVLFRQRMNDINARFGRHITISHRATPQEKQNVAAQRPVRPHVAVVLKDKAGQTGIKVLPRYRDAIADYCGTLKRNDFNDFRVYGVVHPFFEQYPVSRALRYHIIKDLAALEAALADAVLLVTAEDYETNAFLWD